MKKSFILFLLSIISFTAKADNGHNLWLTGVAKDTKSLFQGIKVTLNGKRQLGDGYEVIIRHQPGDKTWTRRIIAGSRQGAIYGAFALKRIEKTRLTENGHLTQAPVAIDITERPAYALRIINHWDNLDGSIERGYAGKSIFWNSPVNRQTWAERINEYARAEASIGINGSVLNNVNASPKMLSRTYLDSVKVIADILRPWGVKVYLSVNFGTPKALGYTETADPLDQSVIKWWNSKVKEIYKLIPDFGGFLVKANSEGQPGPFDYGRTHADGANMLADALKPYGGIVMWRSFVYGSKHKGEDRVMQAVSEFKDLDGQFRGNVLLQSKNGPLDFQPREPYAPIFDNMKKTDQMAEFQITQEYTGQSQHLVYLGTMWKEFFSFIAPNKLKGIAGVSNVGDDANWCAHPFSQANWYAFGRLAWNPELSADEIADEWTRQTLTQDTSAVAAINKMMMTSRETCVDYMMPLGLHHIFKFDHHYGPEPDGFIAEYPLEWCPVYYHKADSIGVGFDRTIATGSGATAQYREPYRSQYENINTCPEEYLLWFHHVAWTYKMKNGKTLWQNLCEHYNHGLSEVERYQRIWGDMKPYIDAEQWEHTNHLLDVQEENAKEWRTICLNYFRTFAHQPIEE